MSSSDDQVDEATHAVRRIWPRVPQVALILGTGLGAMAADIQAEAVISYADVPHLPRATALAHKGQFVCGTLAGAPVIAMQGRCHLYEGYSVQQITLPLRVMSQLGAKLLIVSNAAGGLNPLYAAGDIMLITDYINFMWQPMVSSAVSDAFGRPFYKHRSPYDNKLIDVAASVARRNDFAAHRGVYVAVTGPNYETRAEYRLFRRIGGDAVGMSTVPEVACAAECGLRVLALSVITNIARPDVPLNVDAEEVIQAAMKSESRFRHCLMEVVRQSFQK